MKAHGCVPLAVLLCCACAGAPSRPGVPPTPAEDPDSIRELPGYRTEVVAEPIFGGQAYVLEAGPSEGPVIVLVHGLGETGARDFYPVLPALAARHRVLAFDLPGFGRSTRGTELYSPERYATFVRWLAGPRARPPFALVGHSMGAAVALAYAAKHPADVQRLVLIDAAGILHRKAFVQFAASAGIDDLFGGQEGAGQGVSQLLAAVASPYPPVLLGSTDPTVFLQNDVLRRTVLGSAGRIAALATILEDFGPAIAEVKAPTTVLWGARDTVAPPRTGRLLAARLASATLTMVDGAGHDPMSSHPDLVAGLILNAVDGPKPSAPQPRPPSHAAPLAPWRCRGQDGAEASGDYLEVEIDRCTRVHLRDVRAGVIRVVDSDVVMERVEVHGQSVALQARRSRIELTAAELRAEVALDVAGGELDLAGVTLYGRRAAARVGEGSKVLFSVSRLISPINQRHVHDVVELGLAAEL